jgi:hypothetical protein
LDESLRFPDFREFGVMPFTPTHVLAVIPIAAFCRGTLPFSALVIGSMIPDFPLFSPLSPSYETTHSAVGLLSACLPLGLACFVLFHSSMKRPLLALLPRAIQARCASLPAPPVGPSPWALVPTSVAIVVGAATHLVWDSFTHRGRWGMRLLPGLNETALTMWGHAMPGFKVLQYGSTVIGLPCLMLLLAIWLLRRNPAGPGGRPGLSVPSKVVALLVAAAIPASVTVLVWRRDDLSQDERLGRSITLSGLVLMMATFVYCLAFHAIAKPTNRSIALQDGDDRLAGDGSNPGAPGTLQSAERAGLP